MIKKELVKYNEILIVRSAVSLKKILHNQKFCISKNSNGWLNVMS